MTPLCTWPLSLLIHCLPLFLTQSITQSPSSLTIPPGGRVYLNCQVLGAGDPFMYWYRQDLGGGALSFVSYSVSAGSVQEMTLSHFNADRGSSIDFSLTSDGAFVNDSGTYYCAWSRTGKQAGGTSQQELRIVTRNKGSG
ncbi:hypothetical protein GDO86_018154 [Hymenochirus boettgeri]|uniref:Ig-like domain-containing protein n=1 Tax=Hymenochirus boettgeri TaxID=247094 RepID=A0A8T2ICF4_9PIPI|nr:hypothetical protein GDO86_018154 [Hymenochirus boettgeri]